MKKLCHSSTQNKDRISYLPELIQAHIISHLPIKDAIKSKILSSRWRSTCSSLSKLEFHQYPGCYSLKKKSPGGYSLKKKYPGGYSLKKKSPIDFRNIVDETLILHDGSDIQSFGLSIAFDEQVITPNHVNSWISFAVQHNVEDFSLTIIQPHANQFESLPLPLPLPLPHCLFRSCTLTKLRLRSISDLNLPVTFPVLKLLEICNTTFHHVTNSFFSSIMFPRLENLFIDGCIMSIHTLLITISTLKNLRYSAQGRKSAPIVKVSTPNLQTICFQDSIPPDVSLLQSSTLTKLTLNSINDLTMPNLIVFPVLKSFELEKVTFRDINNRFFSRRTFPMLEDLVIAFCTTSVGTLSITISTLKHLTYVSYVEVPTVKLSTPNLETINYEGYVPPVVKSSNLLSVLTATYFDIKVPHSNLDDSVGDLYYPCVSKILTEMCNAQKLFLASGFVENLARNQEFITGLPAPQFQLKELYLCWFRTKRNVQAILFLLRSSPNLETLSIDIDVSDEEPWDEKRKMKMEETFQLKELSYAYRMKHIRKARITDVIGNSSEINIAKYLLENGSNLKEMQIWYSSKLEHDPALLKETLRKFSYMKSIYSHVKMSFRRSPILYK